MKIDTTPRTVCAVTDTGCQTTTCGAEILDILNIDRNHLIPISHVILGITDARLNIIGSIFAQIQLKNRSTKQMIQNKFQRIVLVTGSLQRPGNRTQKLP